ncbi:phosphate acetyltransferase [Desulfopila sp. IMCC35008]|uniref:phosphate acetyltransferase n=1 Tax=Desulfopila sp. IMCC35008 TaxID=2653858 RepID=UPI0013D8A73F|nr:phosphate acetyltransferase [Desulfopila sp. IMCC35008]
MANNLYIAATGPESGKSTLVLGVMETLSRRIHNIGFFRPVIKAVKPLDNDIQLVLNRYNPGLSYDDTYGCTYAEAREMIATGQIKELLNTILSKYKKLERQCDFVLCEGTDYTGVSSALEFDFNAQVASNLGCPVMIVINGNGKDPDDIADAVRVAGKALDVRHCTVAAACINRIEPDQMKAVGDALAINQTDTSQVYLLPVDASLENPTVGDIITALGARLLSGGPEALNREVLDCKVAAMQLPHFLDHISDGTLVITPGDRADIQLCSTVMAFAQGCPSLAGILLTGGIEAAPQIVKVVKGLPGPSLPVMLVNDDTYVAAIKVHEVPPTIAHDNERKIARALGLFESYIDGKTFADQIVESKSETMTPIMFQYRLIERAKTLPKHILLAEGAEDRILRAAEILIRRQVCDLTLLGDEAEINRKAAVLGLDVSGAHIVDPINSEWLEDFTQTFFELRKKKGVTIEMARDAVLDPSCFGTMMVHKGHVDGMVSGAVHSTANTIRPSLQIIKTKPDCSIVSSVFLMCLADRVLVYGDCAVNPDPNAAELADIAVSSADTARHFGIEPLVAMCSYSSGTSGKGENVDKVREATEIARKARPDLKIEGPIQYDAAVDAGVAKTKMPNSDVAGRATVFIFPDLDTGNNLYKAVQRSSGAVAIGPVLQGLKKPVNDLSRGCLVTDIVNTVAVTAIMAQTD